MIISNNAQKNLVVSFIQTIRANAMGAQVTAEFVVDKMRKGTAKNRSEAYNRFFNEATGEWRVTKVTHYGNVTFQREYTKSVENRSDNDAPYAVEKPNGKHWVEGCEGVLLESDKEEGKYYLRMSENANTKRESVYYVDGRLATDEEVEIIKAHLPKPSTICKKQIEYGVDPEHQVIVKDITLANIINITYGAKSLTLRQQIGSEKVA